MDVLGNFANVEVGVQDLLTMLGPFLNGLKITETNNYLQTNDTTLLIHKYTVNYTNTQYTYEVHVVLL